MGCIYCEGLMDKQGIRPPARNPILIDELDGGCFGNSQLSIYIVGGKLDVIINPGVVGKTYEKRVNLAYCPMCRSELVQTATEEEGYDFEYDE